MPNQKIINNIYNILKDYNKTSAKDANDFAKRMGEAHYRSQVYATLKQSGVQDLGGSWSAFNKLTGYGQAQAKPQPKPQQKAKPVAQQTQQAQNVGAQNFGEGTTGGGMPSSNIQLDFGQGVNIPSTPTTTKSATTQKGGKLTDEERAQYIASAEKIKQDAAKVGEEAKSITHPKAPTADDFRSGRAIRDAFGNVTYVDSNGKVRKINTNDYLDYTGAAKATREAYDVYNIEKNGKDGAIEDEVHNFNATHGQEDVDRGNKYADQLFSRYLNTGIDNAIKEANLGIDTDVNTAANKALKDNPDFEGDPYSAIEAIRAKKIASPEKVQQRLNEAVGKVMQSLMGNKNFQTQLQDAADTLGISKEAFMRRFVSEKIESKIGAKIEDSVLDRYLPKSTGEYIMSGVGNSIVGTAADIALGLRTPEQREASQNAAEITRQGKNPYVKNQDFWTNAGVEVGRGAMGMLPDATFGVFKVTGKGAQIASDAILNTYAKNFASSSLRGRLLDIEEQLVKSGVEKAAAKAYVQRAAQLVNQNKSFMGRWLQNTVNGVPNSAINMMLYEGLNGGLQSLSTEKDVTLSAVGRALLNGGAQSIHGLGTGVGMGIAGAFGGAITGKVAGKVGVKTGERGLDAIAHGAQKFGVNTLAYATEIGGMSLGDYITKVCEGKADEFGFHDVIDSAIMVTGMKLGEPGNWQKAMHPLRTLFKAPKGSTWGMSDKDIETIKEIAGVDDLEELLTDPSKAIIPYNFATNDNGVSQAQYNYLNLMNQLSWEGQNKLTMALSGQAAVSRPRLHHFAHTADGTLCEVDKDGKVISYKKFNDKSEEEAYKLMRWVRQDDDDMHADYAVALMKGENSVIDGIAKQMGRVLKTDEDREAFVDEMMSNEDTRSMLNTRQDVNDPIRNAMTQAAMNNGFKSSLDIVRIMNKDPMRRTRAEWEAVQEFGKALHDIAYPKGEVHVEQSKVDGEKLADDTKPESDEPNVEKLAEASNEATQDEQTFLAALNDAEWADDYNKYIKQGKTPKEAYDLLLNEDGYNVGELAPLADYVNAQAKQEGIIEKTGANIQNNVDERVNLISGGVRIIDGNQNGNVVHLQLSDNTEVIFLSGNLVSNGGKYKSEQPIIVMDNSGNPHTIHADEIVSTTEETLEDYANRTHGELGVKATGVIDPTGQLNPVNQQQQAPQTEQKVEEEPKQEEVVSENETTPTPQGESLTDDSVLNKWIDKLNDNEKQLALKIPKGKQRDTYIERIIKSRLTSQEDTQFVGDRQEQYKSQGIEKAKADLQNADKLDDAQYISALETIYGSNNPYNEGRFSDIGKEIKKGKVGVQLPNITPEEAEFIKGQLAKRGFEFVSVSNNVYIFRKTNDGVGGGEASKVNEGGVPRDEKGRRQYTADGVTPSMAVDDLYNSGVFSKEEANDYIDEKLDSAKKNYEKVNKPISRKKNEEPDDYMLRKEQHNQEVAQAKQEADRWQAIYDEAHRFDVPQESETKPDVSDKEFAEAMAGFENDPLMIICANLPKITPESYYSETGLSSKDKARNPFFVASEAKGGKTVDQAVLDMRELLEGRNVSEKDIRDAIIEIISNGGPRSYAKRLREDYENQLRYAKEADDDRQRNEWAQEHFGMDYDEWVDSQEAERQNIEANYKGVDGQKLAEANMENWQKMEDATKAESKEAQEAVEVGNEQFAPKKETGKELEDKAESELLRLAKVVESWDGKSAPTDEMREAGQKLQDMLPDATDAEIEALSKSSNKALKEAAEQAKVLRTAKYKVGDEVTDPEGKKFKITKVYTTTDKEGNHREVYYDLQEGKKKPFGQPERNLDSWKEINESERELTPEEQEAQDIQTAKEWLEGRDINDPILSLTRKFGWSKEKANDIWRKAYPNNMKEGAKADYKARLNDIKVNRKDIVDAVGDEEMADTVEDAIDKVKSGEELTQIEELYLKGYLDYMESKAPAKQEHTEPKAEKPKKEQGTAYKVGDHVMYRNAELEVESINSDGSLNLKGNAAKIGLGLNGINAKDVRKLGSNESRAFYKGEFEKKLAENKPSKFVANQLLNEFEKRIDRWYSQFQNRSNVTELDAENLERLLGAREAIVEYIDGNNKPETEKPKVESPKEKKAKTKPNISFKAGDFVNYKGKIWQVNNITEDGKIVIRGNNGIKTVEASELSKKIEGSKAEEAKANTQAALDEFKKVFGDNISTAFGASGKTSGKGKLGVLWGGVDNATTTKETLEAQAKIIKAAAKFGHALAKQGYVELKDWAEQMAKNVKAFVQQATGWDDSQWDEFLGEIRKFKFRAEEGGERKTLDEWIEIEKNNLKENKNEGNDLRTGSVEEGAGRQQPDKNGALGGSAEHETERPRSESVDGRDGTHTATDKGGDKGLSGVSSEQENATEHVEPGTEKNTHNYRKAENDNTDMGNATPAVRMDANVKAIETLNRLLETGEEPTEEDKKALAGFSGWGGFGVTTDEKKAQRIKELIGEEAFKEMSLSANSSYYTPSFVARGLWKIANMLGFKGGKILEGSAGIGNLLGVMPKDISDRSDIHAVEKDTTTGNILKLLYPDAKVDVKGFEETEIENGSVDLAITNVPFVTGLHVKDTKGDRDLSDRFKNIHDFCIAKNVRKLKPGGIGIFITTSGTMDSSRDLRLWLGNEGNADVVGAFRLNGETFGGTDATSDILIIRKRVNGEKSPNAIDVRDVVATRSVSVVAGTGKSAKVVQKPVTYNKYYVEHPENMGGEMKLGIEMGDTRFGGTTQKLYGDKEEQTRRFNEWIKKVNKEVLSGDVATNKEVEEVKKANEKLGADVKEGSLVVNSKGEICVARRGEAIVPTTTTKHKNGTVETKNAINNNKVGNYTKVQCLTDYNKLRKALSDVIEYEQNNDSDEGLKPLLQKLNRAYDDFVSKYGGKNRMITGNTSLAWLRNDVDFANISGLETVEEVLGLDNKMYKNARKGDIFSKRVVVKESEPKPQNVHDGVIASIFKHNKIDTKYIADALGKSEEDVRKEILDSGMGFEDPTNKNIVVKFDYLSGNVREKLALAEANNKDGRYDKNIAELKKVQPMTVPAHMIEINLGANWIGDKLFKEYIKARTGVTPELTISGGSWSMPRDTHQGRLNATYGVHSKLGITIFGTQLIEAAMRNTTITVQRSHKERVNGQDITVTEKDPEATQACMAKIAEIKDDFRDWIKDRLMNDRELSDGIEKKYNDQFNNYVPKEIPDEFVPERFHGATTSIKLHKHQAKAAIRATMGPVLFAHEVGTGKTFTQITTAMEMRRLGTAKKPMIVVQNATTGQFVKSAKQLYPGAKILSISDKDTGEQGRKNFYAKIKYNDWDMIIVPQSVLDMIPDSAERQMQFIQEKIDEKRHALEALANDKDAKFAEGQAKRELEELEGQLADLATQISQKPKKRDSKKDAVRDENARIKAEKMLERNVDDVEDFDDMGIDAIIVDEAHEYKHLGFSTAMTRGVKGVDPSDAKKGTSLYLKVQSVLEKNNGKNVVFATGTPVSNTAAEVWTFMRYLMPKEQMQAYGIYYFDDFARNFGKISQMLEFTTSGKFKENTRFSGYVNVPELNRIWSQVADTVLTEDQKGIMEKIPETIEGGKKATVVTMPQTKALRGIMSALRRQLEAFEKMDGKQKKANSHIPLVCFGIASKAAIDPRLVLPEATDDPGSKANKAVENILTDLAESREYNGTVALFCDRYARKEIETTADGSIVYQTSHGQVKRDKEGDPIPKMREAFNVYEDIKKKLVARGVPENQIAIVKSGMSIEAKQKLFDKVNRGEVRVIMGSTQLLGVGVNIQERLYAEHHLDVPNRPMDWTQRLGRMLRQGNLHKEWNKKVKLYTYAVEDSLDITGYQRLKTKGNIADTIMHGAKSMMNNLVNRTVEEEEDEFGDVVANLSGSEYALLKQKAERDLRKLQGAKKQWESQQIYIHNEVPRIQSNVSMLEERRNECTGNLDKVQKMFPEGKPKVITIGSHKFNDMSEMEDFFKDYNSKQAAKLEELREKAKTGDEQSITKTLTIDVDGVKFTVTTDMYGEVAHIWSGTATSHRSVYLKCAELGVDTAVKGGYLKTALTDIVENIVTGKDYKDEIADIDERITRQNGEMEKLLATRSESFDKEEELKAAAEKVEEYTEKMKTEMAEKEKKYAEMDKDVEEVDFNKLDSDDNDEEDDSRASEDLDVEEPFIPSQKEKDEAEKQIDNRITELLHPDKEVLTIAENGNDTDPQNGVSPVETGAKRASLGAKVKEKFGSAKGILKKLSSYIVNFPKDGSVTAQNFVSSLMDYIGAKEEGVSRYIRFSEDGEKIKLRVSNHSGNAIRIITRKGHADKGYSIVVKYEGMPTEEMKRTFKGITKRGINVVEYVYDNPTTDRMLKIAKSIFGLLDTGKYTDLADADTITPTHDALNSYVKPENEKIVREYLVEQTKDMDNIIIHDNISTVTNKKYLKKIKQGDRVKGWYDIKTGKVELYLPNIHSKYEANKVIVHETVGHKGLRELLNTKENPNGYQKFIDGVWADKSNTALHEFVKKYAPSHGWDIYEAVDEWLAREAEKNITPEKLTLWGKITAAFNKALVKIGWKDASLNINDVRMAIWLSRNRGNNPNDPLYRARLNAMRDKLSREDYRPATKDGVYLDGTRASEDLDNVTPGGKAVRDEYDRQLKTKGFKYREAFHDSMESLRRLQELIVGKGKEVADSVNAYLAENHITSIAEAEWNKFKVQKFQPVEEAINQCVGLLGGKAKDAKSEIETYLYKKHGLERNRHKFVENTLANYAKSKEGQEAEENYRYMQENSLSPDDMADMDKSVETADKKWSQYQSVEEKAYKDYKDGKISYGEYLGELDYAIREYIDAEYDPNKVDYSGISAFDENRTLEGRDVEYDEQAIIDAVDNMEATLGKENVDNIQKVIKDATDFSVDYTYNSGQADSRTRDGVKGMYHFYIPLRGFAEDKMEDVYETRYGNDGGNHNVGKVIKRADGRLSLADSPLATISAMANSAINYGERNKMLQKFYRLVAKNPNDAVKLSETWETTDPEAETEDWKIAMPELKDDMTSKEIADAIDAFNKEMQQREFEGTARKVLGRPKYPEGFLNNIHAQEHAVRVYINGREKWMWVTGDPRAAQALRGEINHKNNAVAPAKWLMNTTAKLSTSMSPEFILSNTSRDTLFSNANIAAKENGAYLAKFTVNQAKAAALMGLSGIGGDKVGESVFEKYYRGREPKNQIEKMFFEFMDNGGRTGFVAMQELEAHKNALNSAIKGTTNKAKVGNAIVAIGKAIPKGIEEMNMRAELINRFATYMTSREMGRSKMRSVADAKEVSVNFNRHGAGNATEGAWGRAAGAMRDYYMFFNAGMQSMELLYRNMSKDKSTAIKTFAFMGAIPAMVGTAFAMLMSDDEDEKYSNIPSWDRRNNICIPTESGYVKIPLPIELRAFWGMGDIMASLKNKRLRTDESPEFAMAGQISQALPLDVLEAGERRMTELSGYIPLAPTAFRPWLEYAVNKDWTGKQIEKDNKFNPDAPYWTRAYSSVPKPLVEICKWVHDVRREGKETAQETDVTGNSFVLDPSLYNHILKSYFSGAYSMTLKVVGAATADEFDPAHLPMVSRLWGSFTDKEADATTNAKYWAYKREADNTNKEYSNKANKANPLAITELNNSGRGKRAQIYKKAEKTIKKLQKQIDSTTDKEQKYQYMTKQAQIKRDLVDALDKIE